MRAISYAPPTAETSCVALSHVAQSQASLGMHTGLEHSRRAHSRSFSDAHTHTGNRVCMYWQTSQLCTVIKTQSAKCTHAEKRSVLTHLHTYIRINQYFPVGGGWAKGTNKHKKQVAVHGPLLLFHHPNCLWSVCVYLWFTARTLLYQSRTWS